MNSMESLAGGAWRPDSWREKPAAQQPAYPDPAALESALVELSRLPPLVTSWEIERLKEQLAGACRGEQFLLQGGDCSESFADCESAAIAAKLKILLQMSLVLVHGTCHRVIRVGRFAGQYAKPRSSDEEVRDGVRLPAFRGDLVNAAAFEPEARRPDPSRLLRAYERSALTLNFIRGLIEGGFADLHHPENWDLGFVHQSPRAAEYMKMVESIGHSIRFMETLAGSGIAEMNRVDFFASHEALHLPYEQAQTRRVPHREGWYLLSTHFPWLGNRTRLPDGAHVEFLRGIENPVAVKIGPPVVQDEVIDLCDRLNPANEPGRLTIILRYGASRIARELPPLVDAVRRAGRVVLWSCDPMHGNTEVTPDGVKTRRFDRIVSELETCFAILREAGTRLGGVHLELTGENVTECLGGASGVAEADLGRAYRTPVDPRLNYEQSLEIAMRLSRLLAPVATGR